MYQLYNTWVACQAPLSIGFSEARILKWIAIPLLRDLPNLRFKLVSFSGQILYHPGHIGSDGDLIKTSN